MSDSIFKPAKRILVTSIIVFLVGQFLVQPQDWIVYFISFSLKVLLGRLDANKLITKALIHYKLRACGLSFKLLS